MRVVECVDINHNQLTCTVEIVSGYGDAGTRVTDCIIMQQRWNRVLRKWDVVWPREEGQVRDDNGLLVTQTLFHGEFGILFYAGDEAGTKIVIFGLPLPFLTDPIGLPNTIQSIMEAAGLDNELSLPVSLTVGAENEYNNTTYKDIRVVNARGKVLSEQSLTSDGPYSSRPAIAAPREGRFSPTEQDEDSLDRTLLAITSRLNELPVFAPDPTQLDYRPLPRTVGQYQDVVKIESTGLQSLPTQTGRIWMPLNSNFLEGVLYEIWTDQSGSLERLDSFDPFKFSYPRLSHNNGSLQVSIRRYIDRREERGNESGRVAAPIRAQQLYIDADGAKQLVDLPVVHQRDTTFYTLVAQARPGPHVSQIILYIGRASTTPVVYWIGLTPR